MMHIKSKLKLILAASLMLATSNSAIASDDDMTLMSFKAPTQSFIGKLFTETPNSALHIMEEFAFKFLKEPASYTQRTNMDASRGFKSITIKQKIKTPIRAALMSMPTDFLGAFEAFLQKDAEEQALFHLACDGSFAAVRKLAYTATDPQDCMKFLYIEMLMSFGRSYDFSKMVETTQKLSLQTERLALENAATWLANNFYTKDLKGSIDNEAVGLPELLRDQKNPACSEIAQYSFLRFFSHMGISSVSRKVAMTCLQESAKSLVAAKELLSVLGYLRIFNTESKNVWVQLSIKSADPNFANTSLKLMKKPLKAEPVYTDQKSVIADLERYIGLKKSSTKAPSWVTKK